VRLKNILRVGQEGESVLLLHGYAASAGFWVPYLSTFRDFKLVIPDLSYERPFSAQMFDRLAIKMFESLGRPKFCVAHSLGSHLAVELLKHLEFKIFFIAPSLLFESFHSGEIQSFYGRDGNFHDLFATSSPPPWAHPALLTSRIYLVRAE
jgi:pimeloyl-ACP methyl ester carboxylesterase